MGRLKIVHVIGGGEFGGAEEHLLTLAGSLADEFELHVVCMFPEPLAPIFRERGFPVHVISMQSKLDLSSVGKMAKLIRKEGFHLVHTHGVRANLIGRLAAKRAGIPWVVTTVHSVLAFDYYHCLDRWVNSFTERMTRRITSRFIAVSEILRCQLISEGIPANKVVTIHNGLELDKYRPETHPGEIRRELGIGPDKSVIGVVARLHPVKGHVYLLQALQRLVGERPNLVVVLVGSGPERSSLENECTQLGLTEHVVFTGFRKDIQNLLASFDLLVLPSLSEGQGLVLLEAMAMKKPVLASRVGGVPELVSEGINGLLVPAADPAALADGIERLVTDKQLAARLGEAGRKTVEHNFTARLMAEKTAAVYKSMLGGRKED